MQAVINKYQEHEPSMDGVKCTNLAAGLINILLDLQDKNHSYARESLDNPYLMIMRNPIMSKLWFELEKNLRKTLVVAYKLYNNHTIPGQVVLFSRVGKMTKHLQAISDHLSRI